MILITSSGTVMQFTVLACAELYHFIHGGTLVAELISEQLEDSDVLSERS